jgi:hypothetical protein
MTNERMRIKSNGDFTMNNSLAVSGATILKSTLINTTNFNLGMFSYGTKINIAPKNTTIYNH